MTKQEMIEKLRKQADMLEAQGDYEAKAFHVWSREGLDDMLKDALVCYQDKTHSFGICRSETCAHNSHDPYMEGGTVFILCKEVGKDEDGNQLFVTPNNMVFAYDVKADGYHFAPHYNLIFKANEVMEEG